MGSGVIAHAVLPLCIAAAGTGFMAQVLHVQQRAADTYDNARFTVSSALHLDWAPNVHSVR